MYLSHIIPGLDALEPLFVFIWTEVHAKDFTGTDEQKEVLKGATRGAICPTLTVDALVDHTWTSAPPDCQQLFNELVDKKVIEASGKILRPQMVSTAMSHESSTPVTDPEMGKNGFLASISKSRILEFRED